VQVLQQQYMFHRKCTHYLSTKSLLNCTRLVVIIVITQTAESYVVSHNANCRNSIATCNASINCAAVSVDCRNDVDMLLMYL